MEFIEVPSFTPRVLRYLGEDEYVRLQVQLMHRPAAGTLIRGSGDSANCAGQPKVTANEAGCVSSTTGT